MNMDRFLRAAARIAAPGRLAMVLFGTVVTPPHALYAQANAPAVVSANEAWSRSFWSTLDDIWNARDAERFSQLFTEDASFRFVDRELSLETRAAIQRHFTDQFSRQAANLRHVTQVRENRIVALNVAAVDATVEVVRKGSDDSAPPTVLRRFAVFAVMLKSADGWKIRLLRIYPLPAPTAGVPEGGAS